MSSSPSPSSDLASLVGKKPRRSWLLSWKGLLLLSLLVIAAFLLWRFVASDAGPQVSYATVPVKRGQIILNATATGTLEPVNEVTVGSELTGMTLEVNADSNDRVKRNQQLARIEVRRLAQDIENSRAQLNSAKSKVLQVQATQKEAEAKLARLDELHRLSEGKAPAQADLVTARMTVARAKADVESAQASVNQVEAQLRGQESDLGKSVIRSPIDGVVLKRNLEPGQTVVSNFSAPELFVIAESLEQMKLKVAVAEADIARVKDGQKAVFNVDAWPDRVYEATVTKVSFGSAITNNVVTYETELVVANADLSLRPGMTATADIRVAEAEKVLLVPAAALRFDPGAAAKTSGGQSKGSLISRMIPGPPRRAAAKTVDIAPAVSTEPGQARVWVLREGIPESVEVTTGLSDGRSVEIRGPGLTEGAEVITHVLSTTP